MAALPEYELYAIRYARRPAMRRDHFLLGDPHEAAMDMDYFVWVAVGKESSIVVDMGFSRETAKRRNREFLRCPVESLKLVGVDPDAVRDVVVTHLHYDHAGNFQRFPAARFHLQEPEIRFATGRSMCSAFFRLPYEVEDIVDVVRLTYAERVSFHDGPFELTPGIELQPLRGHTPGLQAVRVHTRRGWVLLLSDAAHYFENVVHRRPFPLVVDVPQMMDSFDRARQLAGGLDRLVPGHDPLVLEMYPPPRPELKGAVARLDVEPDMAVLEARLSQ
ncbi:N-acyl homoserine lactonase family protein [Azohydromonas australica]|uniref:N-acyl homoserine lactonase family protein n=1 Tax=Azohydromonas australica TaxID=364039 RepID=UPI0003F81B6B|nr:N-acyl homoserine lactonase family protein [Azohydromonas australica]